MALDPTLSATLVPRGRILRAASELLLPGAEAFAVASVTPPLTLYRRRDAPRAIVFDERLLRGRSAEETLSGSVYADLDEMGLVCIAGIPTMAAPCLPLSGGSVSSCSLDLQRGKVNKRVQVGSFDDRDGIQRHRAEALWLSDRQSNLFPETRVLLNLPTECWFEIDFIPQYTLGELLLQRRYSFSDVKICLSSVLERLSAELYCSQTTQRQTSYIEIVSRRLDRLVLRRLDPVFGALLSEGAVINGLKCRPILDQLAAVTRSSAFRAVTEPVGGVCCHGDLIPEDILPDAKDPRSVFLVDPNPLNASELVDAGKLLMAFLVRYDLAYRDLFALEYEMRRPPVVNYVFRPQDAALISLFDSVACWLAEHFVVGIDQACGTAGRLTFPVLLAQAALHAMALPTFHVEHHGRTERGILFLTTGMCILERALREVRQ